MLDWALNLEAPRQWTFYGCLGPEDRSIAAYLKLSLSGLIAEHDLLKIEEMASPNFNICREKIRQKLDICSGAGLTPRVTNRLLMDPIPSLDPLLQLPINSSIIVDISSLPKRYFFYILKVLFRSPNVQNLVVVYTAPAGYTDEPLSEDNDQWDALPTFRSLELDEDRKKGNRLVVNIGFMPEGLLSHVESPDSEKNIDLIFPFPSSVPAVQRAWQSVWALSASLPNRQFAEHRVGANDMSEAFDRILTLRPNDSDIIAFAPFGPKPISAAICLYASITGSPVYYAQPKIYNPNYSIGVGAVDGQPEIYGYWVKHEGQSLYNVPPRQL